MSDESSRILHAEKLSGSRDFSASWYSVESQRSKPMTGTTDRSRSSKALIAKATGTSPVSVVSSSCQENVSTITGPDGNTSQMESASQLRYAHIGISSSLKRTSLRWFSVNRPISKSGNVTARCSFDECCSAVNSP